MAQIKAYTGYREWNNTHLYTIFDIIEEVPEGAKLKPVSLDCEQGNDCVYDYNYFEMEIENEYYDPEYDDEDCKTITEMIAIRPFTVEGFSVKYDEDFDEEEIESEMSWDFYTWDEAMEKFEEVKHNYDKVVLAIGNQYQDYEEEWNEYKEK